MNTLKIAVALLALTIGRAYALGVGECHSIADMTEKLKAEDQHSFLVALRPTKKGEGFVGEGTHKWVALLGMMITSNNDGSLGYILQTDKPFYANPSQSCVYARLSHIHFYDARASDNPPSVYTKATRDEALAQCQKMVDSGEIPVHTCRYLNDLIKNPSPNGDLVTLQANNQRKQPDGSYKDDGILVTVTANLKSKNDDMAYQIGDIFNTTSEGATVLRDTIHEIKYTKNGEVRLTALNRHSD